MVKPRSVAFRMRGYVGLAVMLPTVAVVLASRPRVPPDGWSALAMDGAGWVFFCAAIFLRISSILFVGGRKGETLIRSGPYSACRNPLYLGSICLATASAFYMHSVLLLAAVLPAAGFYVLLVVPAEERQLAAAFPREWQEYRANVPRLWPRLVWRVEHEYLQIELRSVRNELYRVLGMASIPLLARVVTQLRVQSWWPAQFTLP